MTGPFDARSLRELATDALKYGPPVCEGRMRPLAEGVLALLDACDEAYERLCADDPMGARLTLGWPRV